MIISGVKLVLEPGTRVPRWIRYQELNVETGRERLNGRAVRFLKIRKGQASFFVQGTVIVKMPGSKKMHGAFQPMRVLEIRDLKGNYLIKRNHYLCTGCATLTGKKVSHKSSERSGFVDVIFECSQCEHRWELKGI